jgi:diadenosine tetraphosphatase ApaH/serine/threonine PP2A family protein phosphatase
MNVVRFCLLSGVLAAVLTGCSSAESTPDSTLVAPPAVMNSGLVGVVGHWSDTTIGTPATLVNGEAWNGRSDTASVDSAGRRWFNEANASFIANMTSPTGFPVAIAGEVLAFSSGTLRVEFNMVGGKSDQMGGLMFGLQPDGEYHYVRYNTKDGNVALWRFRNGDREVIHHGDVHKQLPLGTWHELVVELNGASVRGYIAGDTTISVTHTLEAPQTGRVGVWVKRDAITAFRNFTARP